MTGRKRVAIIGAGMSGLAAIKSCLEEGLEPTCFEQSEGIGGVWFYTEAYGELQGSRAFDKLTANISKEFFAYSDFPYPYDAAPFPTHSDVQKYLQLYSHTFGLDKYITLKTRVEKISRSHDYDVTGIWEVKTVTNYGTPRSQMFDCVMVCSGFFKEPVIPEIKGIDTFKGDIRHSIAFRSGERYKHKRVLVVGNGNSSGDLAADCASFADQVFYCVGDGMWMIPRFTENGKTYDYRLMTRSNFKSVNTLNKILDGLSRSRFDPKRAGFFPSTIPVRSHVIVNDLVQTYIMNGKIKILGRLVRLGPREAEFDDGSVVHDIDAVLFATGYKLSINFLDEDILDASGKLYLYRMVFPLNQPHSTMALVGCQDVFGSNIVIQELQARMGARVFSGKLELPSKDVMEKEVEKRNEELFQMYGRYKYWLPYFPYRDELGEELGISPSWLDLIKAGPKIAYNYLYGPAFPYQDRLWGPHTWSGAREAIEYALEHGYYAKQPRNSNRPEATKTSKWISGVVVCAVLGAAGVMKYFGIENFITF